jgi:EmrB/QacA subfamily drug resistance transporter
MNTAAVSRVEHDGIDPRVWRITGVVALAPLMTSLDSTVVNVSLSTLGQELRVPLITIQWVVTGYLLALALMLPLSGWLVDRVGAKRLYLGCFAAFTCASLLCGVSITAATLIGSRILQGMAGGLLAPMAQMMIARQAGRHVARVMGVMVVPVLLGPICGPTLAGLILQHASWRWIFFINLPIGILAISLAGWILPRDHRSAQVRNFDLPGFLLLSPGLVLLLYSLESLSASSSGDLLDLSALALSIGLLICFAVYAKGRAGGALIDLRLFRNATFAAAAVTQFLSNAVSIGGQMLLPLYLLSVPKISPTETGLLLAPAGLGMLCSYPSMGPLTERYGARRISATGACVALVGTLPFAWFGSTHMPGWEICAALFVRGVGLGAISIPSIAAAYSSISKEAIPVATTAINIFQRLGGPVATTVLAIYLHARITLESHHDALAQSASLARAFAATFWLLCLIHVAVVVAASRLPLWAHQHDQTGDYDAEQAMEVLTE